MNNKIINAGNCMLCGREIKIVAKRGNNKLPNIFFCQRCEKQRGEYIKGYNDALDKIRKEVVCLTYYWCEVNPNSVKEDVLEIIDKCKLEG